MSLGRTGHVNRLAGYNHNVYIYNPSLVRGDVDTTTSLSLHVVVLNKVMHTGAELTRIMFICTQQDWCKPAGAD